MILWVSIKIKSNYSARNAKSLSRIQVDHEGTGSYQREKEPRYNMAFFGIWIVISEPDSAL